MKIIQIHQYYTMALTLNIFTSLASCMGPSRAMLLRFRYWNQLHIIFHELWLIFSDLVTIISYIATFFVLLCSLFGDGELFGLGANWLALHITTYNDTRRLYYTWSKWSSYVFKHVWLEICGGNGGRDLSVTFTPLKRSMIVIWVYFKSMIRVNSGVNFDRLCFYIPFCITILQVQSIDFWSNIKDYNQFVTILHNQYKRTKVTKQGKSQTRYNTH